MKIKNVSEKEAEYRGLLSQIDLYERMIKSEQYPPWQWYQAKDIFTQMARKVESEIRASRYNACGCFK